MATIESLRNSIIDKLLTITNKDYLTALHQLVENSTVDNDIVKLTAEQKLMLELSEEDIKNNRLVTHSDLDKLDRKWLSEL